MQLLNRPRQYIAFALAAVAGLVDSAGFMASGGYFLSFMSGNSTRFAVDVSNQMSSAVLVGGLLISFVFGVTSGGLVGRGFSVNARKSLIAVVVALLLFAAPPLAAWFDIWAALWISAFAMGMVNMMFIRDGKAAVGLTYMTGALVNIGQALAHRITGEKIVRTPYFGLWLGFVLGATSGAISFHILGFFALWIGAALLFAIAIYFYSERN